MQQTEVFSTRKKIKIIKEYLEAKYGPTEIYELYGVKKVRLYEWVRKYRASGETGLEPVKTSRTYDPDLKMKAVIDYLSGAESIRKICSKYEINDGSTLRGWIKWYNTHGSFKKPERGEKLVGKGKGRDTTLDERIDIISFFIANDMSYAKTIEQYNVSYHQIYRWYKKYEQHGPDGLSDLRGKRKDESSMNELEKLRAQVKFKDAENLRLQMENDLLKKLGEIERRRGRN